MAGCLSDGAELLHWDIRCVCAAILRDVRQATKEVSDKTRHRWSPHSWYMKGSPFGDSLKLPPINRIESQNLTHSAPSCPTFKPCAAICALDVAPPGIEKILEASMAVDNHVHLIFGGLHLVTTSDPEVERIADALHEKWKVDLIAPGHCTGEPAFVALQKAFGERYLYAGLGTILKLP
jgi:hypothetical protein